MSEVENQSQGPDAGRQSNGWAVDMLNLTSLSNIHAEMLHMSLKSEVGRIQRKKNKESEEHSFEKFQYLNTRGAFTVKRDKTPG